MNIRLGNLQTREVQEILIKIRDDESLNVGENARKMADLVLSKYEPEDLITVDSDGNISYPQTTLLSLEDKQFGIDLIKRHCKHVLYKFFKVEKTPEPSGSAQVLESDTTYFDNFYKKHIKNSKQNLGYNAKAEGGDIFKIAGYDPGTPEDKKDKFLQKYHKNPPTEAFGCPADNNAISTTGNNPNVYEDEDITFSHLFDAKLPNLQDKYADYEHPILKDESGNPKLFVNKPINELTITFEGEDLLLDLFDPETSEVTGTLTYKFEGVKNIALGHVGLFARDQFGENTWKALTFGDEINPHDTGNPFGFNQTQMHLDEQTVTYNPFARQYYIDNVLGRDESDLRFSIGVPTLEVAANKKSAVLKGLADINPFLYSTKFPGKYSLFMIDKYNIPDTLPFPGEKGEHILYSEPRVDQYGNPYSGDFPDVSSIKLQSTDITTWETVSKTDVRLNLYYVHQRDQAGSLKPDITNTWRPYVSTGGPNYVAPSVHIYGQDLQYYHCYNTTPVWGEVNNNSRFRKYIIEIMNMGDDEHAGHASFALGFATYTGERIIDVTNLTDLAVQDSTEMTAGFAGNKNDFARNALFPGNMQWAGVQQIGSLPNCFNCWGTLGQFHQWQANEIHCIGDISHVYVGMPIFGPFVPDGAEVVDWYVYNPNQTEPLVNYYNRGEKVPGGIIFAAPDPTGGLRTDPFYYEYIHNSPIQPVRAPAANYDYPFYDRLFFHDSQAIRGGDGFIRLKHNEFKMYGVLRSNRALWTDTSMIVVALKNPNFLYMDEVYTDSTQTYSTIFDRPHYIPNLDPSAAGGIRVVQIDLAPFVYRYDDAAQNVIRNFYANLLGFSLPPTYFHQQCSHDHFAFVNGASYDNRLLAETYVSKDSSVDYLIFPSHRSDYITRRGADNPYTQVFGMNFATNGTPKFGHDVALPESPYNPIFFNYPYDTRVWKNYQSQMKQTAAGEISGSVAAYSTGLSHPFGTVPGESTLASQGGGLAGNFRPGTQEELNYPFNYIYYDTCNGYYYGNNGFVQLLVTVEGEVSGIINPENEDYFSREDEFAIQPQATIFLDNRHINKIRPTGLSSGTITIENGSSDTCYWYASTEDNRIGNEPYVISGMLDAGLPREYGISGLVIHSHMKPIRPNGYFLGGYNPCYGGVLEAERNFVRITGISDYWTTPGTTCSTYTPGPYCDPTGDCIPYKNLPISYAKRDRPDFCADNDPYYCCKNCNCSPYSNAKYSAPFGKMGVTTQNYYDNRINMIHQGGWAKLPMYAEVSIAPNSAFPGCGCDMSKTEPTWVRYNWNAIGMAGLEVSSQHPNYEILNQTDSTVPDTFLEQDVVWSLKNTPLLGFDPDVSQVDNYRIYNFEGTIGPEEANERNIGQITFPVGCCDVPANIPCPSIVFRGNIAASTNGQANDNNVTISGGCVESNEYGGKFIFNCSVKVNQRVRVDVAPETYDFFGNPVEKRLGVWVEEGYDPARVPEGVTPQVRKAGSWDNASEDPSGWPVAPVVFLDYFLPNEEAIQQCIADFDGNLPAVNPDFINRSAAGTFDPLYEAKTTLLHWKRFENYVDNLAACAATGDIDIEWQCPLPDDTGDFVIGFVQGNISVFWSWDFEQQFFMHPDAEYYEYERKKALATTYLAGQELTDMLTQIEGEYTADQKNPDRGNICRRDWYDGTYPPSLGGEDRDRNALASGVSYPIKKGCRGTCWIPTPSDYINDPSSYDRYS